jgi:hypothetical protein
MNLAKGEISVQEILTLYHSIKNYFQRDKNRICLGLNVLSVNILDWFRENMEMAERLLDGKEIKYGEFFTYTNRDERAPVARESAGFVHEIITPYIVNNVSKNDEHYKTVSVDLNLEVYRFAADAIKPKEEWLGQNKEEAIMKVERNKVEQWVLSLKERKQTIEGQVSTLQSKLECERIRDKDLIERIRAHIQR